MTTPRGPAWPAPTARRAVLALLITGAVAFYLLDPDGAGGGAFAAVAVLGLLALAVGPALRRAEPRRAWRSMALAALLFLAGLTLRTGLLPGGSTPLASPELWTVAGYIAALRSLAGLVSAAARGSRQLAALDAMIVTTGAALGFYSGDVGPRLGPVSHEGLVAMALAILYPVLDAALLALTAHLAIRTSHRSPAILLLLGAMTTWLIADIGYVVLWHFRPFTVSPYLNAVFMVTYALMGLAATHPSVAGLASPATATQAPAFAGQSLILLTLVVPAGAALAIPVSGGLDAGIRITLLALMLLAVQQRMMRTVAALRRAEQAALDRALRDPLTGLPNRTALLAALHAEATTGVPEGLCIASVGADHFRMINDTWGYAAGDSLLRGLAGRLRSLAGPDGQVYRLGGDEFAVVTTGGTTDRAHGLAAHLLGATSEPFPFGDGQKLTVSTSVGVTVTPPGATLDGESLLQNADIALHTAKNTGRGTGALFDASLRSSIERRVRLAGDLHDAVATGEIVPHFQAIMGGPGFGTVTGFEALARWTSPEHGPVSPADFIPIAEDTGLIVDIGALLLRQSCHHLAAWRHSTGQDLHMSVNVSAIQIARCDVPGLVSEALDESGLPPGSLWLEITESLLVTDRNAATRTLDQLAQLGVVLAIDDFGTGYSSLSYLKDFPVQIVKLDRSFVRQLTHDRRTRGVTAAIIEMVRALELAGVVAEGVEQPAEASWLESMGCTWGQGFLWARPRPAAEILAGLLDVPTGTPAPG